MKIRTGAAALGLAALTLLGAGAVHAKPGRGKGPGHRPGRGVLTGTVKTVTPGTTLAFTVQRRGFRGQPGPEVSVATTADTKYRKSDGTAATAADVTVGAKVAVRGTRTAPGSLTARGVLIRVPRTGE